MNHHAALYDASPAVARAGSNPVEHTKDRMNHTAQRTHAITPSLADRAFHQLQKRLIFLDIKPGDPINESQLSHDLQVGRTPLREALKRLESDSLVTTYPRRGTFATAVDITVLSEISEVRQALEPLAASCAAQRHDQHARQELTDLKHDLEQPAAFQAGDELRRDLTVHRAIYAACGNPHLEATLTRYGNLATRIWCVAAARNPTPIHHVTQHTELLDAILTRRADDARHLMDKHIMGFARHMRRIL